ncbi:MAG: hypothetical protein MHM6MM_001843 [Cercozoa sp. M6MM]
MEESYQGDPQQPYNVSSDEGDDIAFDDVGVASLPGSVANVVKNVIGSGILSLPFAFRLAGLWPGLLLFLLCWVLSIATYLILAKCAQEAAERSAAKGVAFSYSYKDVMAAAKGPRWAIAVDYTISILSIISCTSYIVLIGDYGAAMNLVCSPDTLCTNRAVQQLVVAVGILLPLCLLRDLSPLKYMSVVGLLAVVYTAVFVVVTDDTGDSVPEDRKLDWWNFDVQLFESVSLLNATFSSHYNAPRFYAELKNRSIKRFRALTVSAYGLVAVLSGVVGVGAYATFGRATKGNILLSYSEDNVGAVVARLATLVSIMGTFALVFNAGRVATSNLLVRLLNRIDRRDDSAINSSVSSDDTRLLVEDGNSVGAPPRDDLTKSQRYALTMFMLICVTTAGTRGSSWHVRLYLIVVETGVLADDVSTVNAIKGALTNSPVTYIFPGMIWLSLGDSQHRWMHRFAYFLIVFGVFTSIVSLSVTLVKLGKTN